MITMPVSAFAGVLHLQITLVKGFLKSNTYFLPLFVLQQQKKITSCYLSSRSIHFPLVVRLCWCSSPANSCHANSELENPI